MSPFPLKWPIPIFRETNFPISTLGLLRAMASDRSGPASGHADCQWYDHNQYGNTWKEHEHGQWEQQGQAEGQPEEPRTQWDQGHWQKAYEVHGEQRQGQGDWEHGEWQNQNVQAPQQGQGDWGTGNWQHASQAQQPWHEEHGGKDVMQKEQQRVPPVRWAGGAYGHSHTKPQYGGQPIPEPAGQPGAGSQKQPSQTPQRLCHDHASQKATSAHDDHLPPHHDDDDAFDKASGCGPSGSSGSGAEGYDWNALPRLKTCWTGSVASMQPWEKKFRCAGIVPNVGRNWFNNKSNQPACRQQFYYQPPAFVLSSMGPTQYNQVLIPVPVPDLPMTAAAMHVPPTPPKAVKKEDEDMESVLEEPLQPERPEGKQQQTWTQEEWASWYDEQAWMTWVEEQEKTRMEGEYTMDERPREHPGTVQPKMRPQPPLHPQPPGLPGVNIDGGPPPPQPCSPPVKEKPMPPQTPASGHQMPRTSEKRACEETTPNVTSAKTPEDTKTSAGADFLRPKAAAPTPKHPEGGSRAASKAVAAVLESARDKKPKAKGAATRSPSTKASKKKEKEKEQQKVSKAEKGEKQKHKVKEKNQEKDRKNKGTKKRSRSASRVPSPSPTCS